MQSEAKIQHDVRLALGATIPLWRNEVGVVRFEDKQGKPRTVSFGLCKGSSDLIGIRPLLIIPEHVGRTIGQFVAFELKTVKGRATKEQKMFLELIERNGGVAAIVRSVEDAREALA